MPAQTHIPVKCDQCVVRHRSICASLTEDELQDFNRIARQKYISAGQVITTEDDVVFANIVHGVIKLTKTLADGRQQIVGLQFPPDFMGRVYAESSPFFAEAATDVELCAFPAKGFESMVKKYPDLEKRLFKDTLDELDSAREWMLLLGRKTAREKVSSLLYMLAKRAPEVGCHHSPEMNFSSFIMPLTRADLADYLGLTLETVSRQITALKEEGAIELLGNRNFTIPDMHALEEAAGI